MSDNVINKPIVPQPGKPVNKTPASVLEVQIKDAFNPDKTLTISADKRQKGLVSITINGITVTVADKDLGKAVRAAV